MEYFKHLKNEPKIVNRQLLLVVFFLPFVSLFSQNKILTERESWTYTQPEKSKIGTHIAPLSFIGDMRLRLGGLIEQQNFSYALDLEYGINRNHTIHYRMYGIRPEFRYFIDYRSYISIEIPIDYKELEVGHDIYKSKEGFRYEFDNAIQKRTRISVLFKIGRNINLGQHFYIDFYAGLGVRNRYVAYVNEENRRVTMIEETLEWGSSSDNLDEGKQTSPNIALGFRLGYWWR